MWTLCASACPVPQRRTVGILDLCSFVDRLLEQRFHRSDTVRIRVSVYQFGKSESLPNDEGLHVSATRRNSSCCTCPLSPQHFNCRHHCSSRLHDQAQVLNTGIHLAEVNYECCTQEGNGGLSQKVSGLRLNLLLKLSHLAHGSLIPKWMFQHWKRGLLGPGERVISHCLSRDGDGRFWSNWPLSAEKQRLSSCCTATNQLWSWCSWWSQGASSFQVA